MKTHRFPVFLGRNAADRLAVEQFFHAARGAGKAEKNRLFSRYDHDFRGNRRDGFKKIQLRSKDSRRTLAVIASDATISSRVTRWEARELTKDDMDIGLGLIAALADRVGKDRFEMWFGPRTRIDWDW